MKIAEVTPEIIGKRCRCIFTGLMVTGTVEGIEWNKYSVTVRVRFDQPHR